MTRDGDLKVRIALNKEAFNESTKRCNELIESILLNLEQDNFEAAKRMSTRLKEERVRRAGFAKVVLQLNQRLKELRNVAA